MLQITRIILQSSIQKQEEAGRISYISCISETEFRETNCYSKSISSILHQFKRLRTNKKTVAGFHHFFIFSFLSSLDPELNQFWLMDFRFDTPVSNILWTEERE